MCIVAEARLYLQGAQENVFLDTRMKPKVIYVLFRTWSENDNKCKTLTFNYNSFT